MKPALVYTWLLAFIFLKVDDHFLAIIKQGPATNYIIEKSQRNNISDPVSKRSPADPFAFTACCDDDDDDDSEIVKKKPGSTVCFSSLNDLSVQIASPLKSSQQYSINSHYTTQPVYIFQRELLI
jgi:hypothetical protein